jgi:hypothetical protein
MSNLIKFINFHNNTDLPINVSSWIDGSNKLHCLKVNPGEKLVIHSSVGEWHLDAMFNESSDRQIWVEKGFGKYFIIGKFRSNPGASGNYSWMEYNEPFDCIFSKLETTENDIEELITFLQK